MVSSKTVILTTLICSFWVMNSMTATLIVKQDGSGNAKTIQAALNAAQNNDIIEIGDDGTYVEDVTVSPVLAQAGIPASPLLSFTLRAATGKHPVIQAANLDTSERMSILGLTGRDLLGMVVWGCNGVTIQGIEIVNLENSVNAFNVQSAFVIADSANVTVDTCTLRGPAAASSGEGSGILIAGVQANPFRTDNITIQNCLITETHYGIISAVFQKGSGADPGKVTIENCQFKDGFESGMDMDNADDTQIRRCTFDNYKHGVHFAGGKTTVEDCLIINSKEEGLEAQVDTNWTDKITSGTVRRCAFIGCGIEGGKAGVRCSDGPIRIEYCIIAGSGGPGIIVTSGKNMEVSATFDHCDVYENLGNSEVLMSKDGSQFAELILTNSNIVSTGSGIINELSPELVSAHHNNVFVKGDAYIEVNPQNSVSFDPMYVSPSNDPLTFKFEGFQLKPGSQVLTAGENGTAIGSQGKQNTAVGSWNLY